MYFLHSSFVSETLKTELRKLNTDSMAYSHIDQKCFLCKTKFEKKDAVFPNKIMEAKGKENEFAVHGNCLNYVMKKYPLVPFTKLEGKVVRMRAENARL